VKSETDMGHDRSRAGGDHLKSQPTELDRVRCRVAGANRDARSWTRTPTASIR
jgi:hypothetical protein